MSDKRKFTKDLLSSELARRTGYTVNDMKTVVDSLIAAFRDEIASGGTVFIPGIGTLSTEKSSKPKVGKNFKPGAAVYDPSAGYRTKVKFRAVGSLDKLVNNEV